MVLTQYTDAAAAQKQVDVTVQNVSDNGAHERPDDGQRLPGHDLAAGWRADRHALRQLDDGDRVVPDHTDRSRPLLQTGLPQLAEAALARILKG